MKSYSQARQDLFVLSMNEHKKNGFYLEIGGYEPIEINNTYLLETEYFWNGISIEINQTHVNKYNNCRKNCCYLGDALKLDFLHFLKMSKMPNQIDYLSIDIEPVKNTLECLQLLPHHIYRFSVITFEHELYKEGDWAKKTAYDFLTKKGYQLVVNNVKNNGNSFEDWYVDPLVIKKEIWENYQFSDIEFSKINF